MKNSVNTQRILVSLLVICSLNFFLAKFATAGLLKNAAYAYLLLSIIASFPFFFRKEGGFVLPVQLICLGVLLSIVMATAYWSQSLSYASSTIPYLVWFVFFLLLALEFPIAELEKIILAFGILYLVLFFFQFTHNSTVYFGYVEEFKQDRGVTRINFPGAGIFFLAFFVSLVKFLNKEKFNWPYLIFLMAGVIATVLQVTRQSIAVILIISLYHVIRNVTPLQRIMVASGAVLIIVVAVNSSNPISKGLLETQKETVGEGDNYIRILAARYFISDFSPNTITRILGNGFPNNNSTYGQHVVDLQQVYGFHIADVGLIGLYIMFGVLPLVGYSIIFVKALVAHVPRKYYYIKYYIWMLLATALISDSVFSTNFLIATTFVLYVYQVRYERDYASH
ncbi:MAG: hypothetical protein ABIS36_20690 [Chryseolinea sp.]